MNLPGDCGHGVKGELPPYRGVRLWEMNCGEIRCSLSDRDLFGGNGATQARSLEIVKEFIDAAMNSDVRPGEWLALDMYALRKAQQAETRPKVSTKKEKR